MMKQSLPPSRGLARKLKKRQQAFNDSTRRELSGFESVSELPSSPTQIVLNSQLKSNHTSIQPSGATARLDRLLATPPRQSRNTTVSDVPDTCSRLSPCKLHVHETMYSRPCMHFELSKDTFQVSRCSMRAMEITEICTRNDRVFPQITDPFRHVLTVISRSSIVFMLIKVYLLPDQGQTMAI